MTHYSNDYIEIIKKAQDKADILLKNNAEFDKVFEEIYKNYDENHDGTIGVEEYYEFLKDMLNAAGKKEYSLSVAMLKFDNADKDGNGNIDKEEFKREVRKKLKDFVNNRNFKR